MKSLGKTRVAAIGNILLIPIAMGGNSRSISPPPITEKLGLCGSRAKEHANYKAEEFSDDGGDPLPGYRSRCACPE